MIYKIRISYGGDNAFSGELTQVVQSTSYTEEVRAILYALVAHMEGLPYFTWFIIDSDGAIVDGWYNDG